MAVEQLCGRRLLHGGEAAWEVGARLELMNANCGLLDLLGGSLKEPAESIKVKCPSRVWIRCPTPR